MAAEFEKLAKDLDFKGLEIAANSLRELSLNLVEKGLIPGSLNGQEIEVFPGNSFGHIIQSYRQERHISQRVLAQKAGVCHSTLSRIERGERIPTLATTFRISKGLGLVQKQEDDLLHVARVSTLKTE